MEKKTLKTYTPKFKAKVLKELEEGKLKSYAEAMRKYKIGGNMTIHKWIVAAGKTNLLHKQEVIDV